MAKYEQKFLGGGKLLGWLRELAAVCFWLLFLSIILFPGFVGTVFESIGLPTTFRFSLLLVVFFALALLWLVLRSFKTALNVAFILLYPVVLCVRYLPKLIYKYSPFFIAFSPAIYSAAKLIRFNIAIFAIAVLSAILVFAFSNSAMIFAGVIAMGMCLVLHFALQLKNAFGAKTVFAIAAEWIAKTWETLKDSDVLKLPDIMSDGKMAKEHESSILTLYLYSSVLGKLSATCKLVAESRKLDIYLIVSWLVTLGFTVFAFAFIYFGIEKAAPGSFQGDSGFFSFVKYSVCVLTTSDLTKVKAVSSVASNVSALELLGSLAILVLLVFLILTSLRDRYKDDLRKVNDELDASLENINSLFEGRPDLSIAALETLLVLQNTTMAKMVMRINHDRDVVAQRISAIQADEELKNKDAKGKSEAKSGSPAGSAVTGGNSRDRRKKRRRSGG